uniref:Uncharacterized protein n=1 Tax=Anguilla anguilla TaxID=7936 RepID=A0A0E9PYC2_ANGAN
MDFSHPLNLVNVQMKTNQRYFPRSYD